MPPLAVDLCRRGRGAQRDGDQMSLGTDRALVGPSYASSPSLPAERETEGMREKQRKMEDKGGEANDNGS